MNFRKPPTTGAQATYGGLPFGRSNVRASSDDTSSEASRTTTPAAASVAGGKAASDAMASRQERHFANVWRM